MTAYRDRHHAGHHNPDPTIRAKAKAKDAETAKKPETPTKATKKS